jgi:formylglycine-generating enzyme required for sulfatase activity
LSRWHPLLLSRGMNVSLRLGRIFGLVSFLCATGTVLGQSSLGIAPANNQNILYFPPSSTNFVLQSTTNVASSNWVAASDATPVTAWSVSNAVPAKFYRLFYATPPAGMVLIPAGWFTIGNSAGDADILDATPTNIYVSGFFMDMNLVTLGQWQAVYTFAISNGYTFTNSGSAKAAGHPVQTVNWFDCVKWCNARSQQAGLTPVYYTDAAFTQVYTNGDDGTTVFANWTASGYRLPTEAEWEKSARGGLIGRRFPWGNLISEGKANYLGATNTYSYDLGPSGTNYLGLAGGYPYTTPAGSFQENVYGLYDMAGDVFQWCWDLYLAPPFPAGSPYLGGVDPRGPGSGTNRRVERGGSWDFGGAGAARCAVRNRFIAASAANTVGFRCVRGL